MTQQLNNAAHEKFLEVFFEPLVAGRELTSEEKYRNEKLFTSVILGTPTQPLVYERLKKYFEFSNRSGSYKDSYWKFYVELTWQNFDNLTLEEVCVVAVEQLITALLLNKNPTYHLAKYLSLNYFDEEEVVSAFMKVKDHVSKSDRVCGKLNGSDVRISDLYNTYTLTLGKNRDALNVADYYSSLKTLLFEGVNEVGEENTIDKMIRRFVKFQEFLMDSNPDQIFEICNNNFKFLTEEIDGLAPIAKLKDNNSTNSKEITPIELSVKPNIVSAPQALIKPPAPIKKNVQEAQVQKKLSYNDIRKKIENSFPKDASGSFISITDVLAELQKISALQGDPRIKDLFFFNEQKGGFEWNEPMFKE